MKTSRNNLKDSFLEENKCIFKKYKPIKKIGYGSFGNIYSAIRIKDKILFAMKTEKIATGKKILESESFYLFTLQHGFGFPKLISYGHTKKYNILIETLLGKSLFNIFLERKIKSNLNDICLIGIQILDRLEFIHSKDIIYRDIKPENFLIGINDPNVIYIVDFGLCKKYRSSKTGKHILPKLTGKFNGTLRYASPNVIRGKESSRRDDLISLGYMLIYLLKRDLPWQETFANLNRSKYFELLYLKDTDGCGKLFKNIPNEFSEYIKYTRKLKFEENPDYSYLRSLFNKVIFNNNFNYKKVTFSWINSKNKELLGIPKNNSKRKESPQSRLLKMIEEETLKKFRQAKSEENIIDNLKVFQIPIHKISLSSVKQLDNNNISDKTNQKENSDLNKIEFLSDTNNLTMKEKKQKFKKIIKKNQNYQNNIKAMKINNNEESSISANNKSISINKKLTNISTQNFFNNDKMKLALVYNKKQIRQIPIPKMKKIIKNKSNNIKYNLSVTENNINNKNILKDRYYYLNNKKIQNDVSMSQNIEYKSPLVNNNPNNINKVSLKMRNITNSKNPSLDNVKRKKGILKNNTLKLIELNKLDNTYRSNINKNNFNIVLINNNIHYFKDKRNISSIPSSHPMQYNSHFISNSLNKKNKQYIETYIIN